MNIRELMYNTGKLYTMQGMENNVNHNILPIMAEKSTRLKIQRNKISKSPLFHPAIFVKTSL